MRNEKECQRIMRREEILERIRKENPIEKLPQPELSWEKLERQIKRNNPQGYHPRKK